jgi:plastocyanin
MKRNSLSILVWRMFCLLMAAEYAQAGDITGTVHAEPKAGADNDASADGAYASMKYKFAERVDYAAMRDFVVYIDGVTMTNGLPANALTAVTTAKVSQHRAEFSPHVLPVLVGTTVEWPNNDDIYHNVFSASDAKPFDLDLYKGNPPDKRVTFDKPGKVDVFCSIHANMHCIVLVMSNPYFAVTDAGGHYTIPNVPPGTYHLKAWHERLPVDTQEVIVPTNGAVTADFTLTIKNLPPN